MLDLRNQFRTNAGTGSGKHTTSSAAISSTAAAAGIYSTSSRPAISTIPAVSSYTPNTTAISTLNAKKELLAVNDWCNSHCSDGSIYGHC